MRFAENAASGVPPVLVSRAQDDAAGIADLETSWYWTQLFSAPGVLADPCHLADVPAVSEVVFSGVHILV
jgi:hypothetical protein